MALASEAVVETLYRMLDVVVSRLKSTRRHEAELIEQRRGLYRQLLDAGETQAAIARRAGVTDWAVSQAVKSER